MRNVSAIRSRMSHRQSAYFLLALLLVGSIIWGCSWNDSEKSNREVELQRRSANPEAAGYLVEAEEAYRQGAYRKALALTDSARSLAPDLADIQFLRGHIFTELTQLEEAEKAYRAVADQVPGYQGVWFNLGNIEFRRGRFRRAITLYQKEMEQQPSARGFTNIGRSYSRLGKPDSAIYALNRALEQDSSHASAYMRLGQVYEDEGQLQKALEYSRKGLELEPENPDYQYIVGSQSYRTGQTEQAVEHLREVVEKRPSHHGAHYNLGQALLRIGREREAKRHLARADSLEQIESEIENLRSVAQSHPDNVQTWLELGARLRDLQRYEEALDAYRVARSLAPTNIVVRGNIANLYQAMGRSDRALRQYRVILEQDSTVVPAWFNMGVIYANNGQKEHARRCWQNVLQYAPDHQRARSYLRRLNADS